MKPFFVSLALCVALVACSVEALAKDPSPKISSETQAAIEKNILAGLNSPITEIRTDVIQLVIDLQKSHPEIDLHSAVIPLMCCLKSGESEELRILAALALISFDSEKAHWAVERRALYDPSERVARHCEDFIHDAHDKTQKI